MRQALAPGGQTTDNAQMSCTHSSVCPLYEVFRSQSLLKVWKLNYCEADFTRCERFKLSCDAQPVPLSLLPNGKHLDIPPK